MEPYRLECIAKANGQGIALKDADGYEMFPGEVFDRRDVNTCNRECHGNHPHMIIRKIDDENGGGWCVMGQKRAAGIHVSGMDTHLHFAGETEAREYFEECWC